jgi:DNA-binding XRE family transcriptional regulator
MKPSPLKHPLAVLRKIIGLGQKELAALVGCSTETIQAIELKKLKLSEELSGKIAEQTGVSAEWLWHADVNVPPRKWMAVPWMLLRKDPYTKDCFKFHRAFIAAKAMSIGEMDSIFLRDKLLDNNYAGLDALLRKVYEQKTEEMQHLVPLLKTAVMGWVGETMVAKFDVQLLVAMDTILAKTRFVESCGLTRWKVRKLVEELAEELNVKLDLKPSYTGLRNEKGERLSAARR